MKKGAAQIDVPRTGPVREIKEWQAIMDQLRGLPVQRPGELPIVPIDARSRGIRAIKAG
jgi:5'-nucleotidase